MRRIYPTNFKLPILVDDADYEDLKQYSWNVTKTGYARRTTWADGKPGAEYLHRRIMKAPKGSDVDHIDQNRFNNQKSNLRLATRSQNMANLALHKKKSSKSKYKGVSQMANTKLKKRWIAYIKKDYQHIHIGYFKTEQEAAHAYNQFAEQMFGDYAYINDID